MPSIRCSSLFSTNSIYLGLIISELESPFNYLEEHFAKSVTIVHRFRTISLENESIVSKSNAV